MNTSKLTSAFATLSFLLFMSIASIANSNTVSSGDLHKSGDKSVVVTYANEKDFSYLRFDVNNFMNETEVNEMPSNEFDYLRFDVNNFMNETEVNEMPSNEFDYLHFDVDNFTEYSSDEITELPLNEYVYLRFDLNNFETPTMDELPESE
jgi:hypothetical protein